MSSDPPPPPTPHASPPPLPPRPAYRLALGTVVAWLVIVAAAGYIVASTVIEKGAVPADARATTEVSFRIAARYAVGVHHTLSALQPAGAASQAEALLPQVDEAAFTPDDMVRAAIVAGEVAGAPAALRRLDANSRRDDVGVLRTIYTTGNADAITDKTLRTALLERHGWYGRLALSYGRAADHPDRHGVLWPAVRTAVVMMAATALGLAALLTGLVLLVLAFLRWWEGRLWGAYRPAVTPTGPFLEAFAAYLAGMVGVASLVRLLLGERLASNWFVVVILPFAFFWPLLRGLSRSELRAGLGWHTGRGVWREIGAGIVGYLAGLPVLAAGAAVTFLLQRFSGSDTSHPIIEQFGQGPWRTAQLFLLAAVWAPVVEETMFRGAFYHHLRSRLPWPWAAAAVAVLFAAVHPQGWAAIPVLGCIAFCFATLREWRGSIIAPVVAHALNNGVVTLLMVLLLA